MGLVCSDRHESHSRYATHATNTQQAQHMGINMESYTVLNKNTNGHFLQITNTTQIIRCLYTNLSIIPNHDRRHIQVSWRNTTQTIALDTTHTGRYTSSNSNIATNRSFSDIHNTNTST